MRPTSATPIISAAAVADVRFGFRFAFSSARRPVMPFTLRIGQPSTALIGRAIVGPEHRDADEDDERAEARPTAAAPSPDKPGDQEADAERA